MITYIEIDPSQRELYEEELKIFGELKENQLYHYYEPELGLFIAESPLVIGRALADGYEPAAFLASKSHLNGEAEKVLLGKTLTILAEKKDIPVYVCSPELYQSVTGLAMTRGMICLMKRRKLPSLKELLAPFAEKRSRVTILDDVENPTNVGAIFRSAAALGMDAVLLTTTCSDPLYRRAARVAMGTVFQIPWTFFEGHTPSKDHFAKGNAPEQYSYIDELHELGYKVCAMALTDRSVSIGDPELLAEEKLAIIMGNEGVGLPDSTIAACDYTVKIPMTHGVDSLNVAAASAVAFYALTQPANK